MTTLRHVAAVFGAGAVLVGATACGGGGGSAGSPEASASPRGPGGGFNIQVLQQAQQCLRAAGVSVPDLPSAPPSGAPGGGSFPSAGATPAAGGRPPGGGGFNAFTSPKAKAALKACGITLPTAPPGVGGSRS